MGIIKQYDKDVANQTSPLIRNPDAPLESPFSNPNQEVSFDKTSLDLENPAPLGGPINVPYGTIIGSEYKGFTTTQPYTPQNTYIDSLKSDLLRARASDPIK